MKCPDCDFDNPEGMKFCGYCGTPLCKICSSCGYSNLSNFEFCGNCGTPLSRLQTTSEFAAMRKYIPSYLAEKIQQMGGNIVSERRIVTIVFSDISGFTALAESRDPEEVSAIATICHTMMGRAVYEYDGVVDKIVGDGMMSIFGIPTRENDPERAILAAIEMQKGMKDLSQELQENMGISLEISIGINTGTVIIGDIGSDLLMDYTVIGDVVNTASRVEGNAKPGEILVTQETYRRTAHCFDFQELEPIRVKGKSQAINVYRAIQRKEKPLQARGVRGLSSQLIGRDREFATCKNAVDQLLAGKGGTLIIAGEAGLGKSRLASELKDYAISQNISCFESSFALQSRSVNYWVFADVMRNYFHLDRNDDIAQIESKTKNRKSAEHVEESTISSIVSLLSPKLRKEGVNEDIPEDERKLQIFSAVRDILAEESRFNPLILILDDLHWIDELSMELLSFLMEHLSDFRITFVCVYRPPIASDTSTQYIRQLEDDYSHDQSDASKKYLRIDLNPLSDRDNSRLLDSLIDVADLPTDMKELILDKAGGNPLYLEEVLRSIIDAKAIEYRDGRWFTVKEIEDVGVPSTVQDVIMARIDRLEERLKNTLQCAAVIGQSFEHDLLGYLVTGGMASDNSQDPKSAPDPLENVPQTILRMLESRSVRRIYSQSLDENLEKLENMGFIIREEGDERIFRFRHVLSHDVTYNSVLVKRRRQLHEMVGSYIGEIYSQRLDEFYEILAYHYSNSNNKQLALAYLIKAGDKTLKSSTGSAGSALEYFSKGMDILNKGSLISGDWAIHKQNVYAGSGEAYEDLGKYEDALSCFEMVLQTTKQTEDFRMRAKALRQFANSKTHMGDWESALQAYEESMTIARDLGDLTQMGFVCVAIGYGYFERGDHDEAMRHFREASRLGSQYKDLRLLSDASNGLGMIASVRGELDEAIQNYQISLKSYKELRESHYEAQAYQNLGIAYFKKNEMETANEYYESSLNISEKCGYIRLRAYTYLSRAELHLWQSNLDKAKEFCERAFQILQTLDDKWACAEGYKFYGMIHRGKRDFRAAQDAFQTSLQISKECDNLMNIAEVYCEMGLMCEEEGIFKDALIHFDNSRKIFDELGIAQEVQRIDSYVARVSQSPA